MVAGVVESLAVFTGRIGGTEACTLGVLLCVLDVAALILVF